MISYKEAGVDIEAGDELVERITQKAKNFYNKNVISGIGGFSALVRLPEGLKEPVLVSGTDGVGTKLKIAFATGIHNTVGIDLVAMCVNDVITSGAQMLFFLDYFATGKLDLETAQQVIEGIVEGCKIAGCPLVGGETAEMPDMYGEGEYDLAGFAVGVVERSKIINGENVKSGDAVIGFPSSGLHSNGFTLVRRLLLDKHKIPLECFIPDLGCTLAEELLRPTVIYTSHVKILKEAGGLKSMAHITGGGIPGNADRNIPQDKSILIHTEKWTTPPIFKYIQEHGVSKEEMMQTFNMGLGFIAVVEPERISTIMEKLNKAGLVAFEIGEIVSRENQKQGVILQP